MVRSTETRSTTPGAQRAASGTMPSMDCRAWFASAWLALTTLATPAVSAPASVSRAQDGAVMTIDGVAISADEYGRWMIDLFASRMARSFGEQHVVRRAAREAGVALATGALDGQIDSEIAERVKGAFSGRRDEWLDELARTGWSEGGHRSYRQVELEPWMLATELTRRGRVVPEELITRDWELFYGPQGKEYGLSAILIAVEVETPENQPKEVYDAARRRTFASGLSKALAVRERAIGGADFAQLAREVSDDPTSRAAGGRIDAKFRPPGWNEHFVQSILALGAGAISTPLYAKGGYWVVRVESVLETPLAAVRAEIERRLIELGPESFEVGATWNRITENLQLELLPSMFEGGGDVEQGGAVIGLRVNGEPVPRAQFASWLLRGRGEHCARDFVEHWCVERRARELGIEATPADVEARIQKFQSWMIDQSYKGSRDAWLTFMRQRGRDEAGWRREWERRLRIDVLCEKIIRAERKVGEAELVAHWQAIYGREGKWIEARMIAVDAEPPALRADMTREALEEEIAQQYERARAKALEIARRLADGEDFATLARSYSSDAESKARGGALAHRFRPDEWPTELSAAVMELAPGEHTPVLATGKGFGIFEVLSTRAVPFEEVREELLRELLDQRVAQGDLAAFRNELYKRARVELTPHIHGGR